MQIQGFFKPSSFLSCFYFSASSDFLKTITRRSAAVALILGCLFMGLAPSLLRAQSITLSPTITTVAGNGRAGFSGDGALASAAQLNQPQGMAMDQTGNIYFADRANNVVRRIDAGSGKITTVAGSGPFGTAGWGGGSYSGDGGPALSATLNTPYSVAVDGAGNLYIADMWNNRIRVVNTQTGTITVAGVSIDAGNIASIAGGGTGCAGQTDPVGDGCPATSAMLAGPFGLALDSTGNVYIADTWHSSIRRVDTTGQITTVAGGAFGFSGDGNRAIGAGLNFPIGVALDSAGNLYIADSYNNRIRIVNMQSSPIWFGEASKAGLMIAPGNIDTVAGSGAVGEGAGGYTGDGDQARSAQLNSPFGVVVDSAGNLYIADSYNNRIRKVDASSGYITTIAGSGPVGEGGGIYNGDGIPATSAQLGPFDLAMDGSGNLYIADGLNNRIRKVSPGTNFGQVGVGSTTTQTLFLYFNLAAELSSVQAMGDYSILSNSCAPLPSAGISGSTCTLQVQFAPTKPGRRWFPLVVTDSLSTQYIFGLQGTGLGSALAFTPGIISTVAGNGTAGYRTTDEHGPATGAELNYPSGMAVDSAGNVYIAEAEDHRVRKVDTSGIITTVAGNGTGGYSGDGGPATSAQLYGPNGVAVDSAGNLYIADEYNNRIRKVDAATQFIMTVAGSGGGTTGCSASGGFSGDGGPATSALLDCPYGVGLDSIGNLYITDSQNNRVRKVDINGIITTVAGNGSLDNPGYGGDGGAATGAQLNNPTGLAMDGAGNLYIADVYNARIRKVDSSGIITTVAGNGTAGYSGDGGPASAAELDNSGAGGIAVDSAGNLYIADAENFRIRKVDAATQFITTVAGIGPMGYLSRGNIPYGGYSGDGGPSTNAALNYPVDLAVDSAGSVYITDSANNRVRKVDVTTSALSFSPLSLGWSGSTQTVGLSNVGNAPLNFFAGFSSIFGGGDFGISYPENEPCNWTAALPTGTTCLAGFFFYPQTTGNPLTETMYVTDDAFNSPQWVTLKGVATPAATHFAVSAQPSATAGTPFAFTVTALDQNNVATAGYPGTLHFTSTDAQAVLPANYQFAGGDNGTHTFTAILRTAGSQTITAVQSYGTPISGRSNTISISADAASHFVVSAPSSATAGSAFSFTVTALDQYSNTAASYRGTAHFTSFDPQAALPADYTFTEADGGSHTFSATLNTAGTETISTSDTINSSVTGSANVTLMATSPVFAAHPNLTAESGSPSGAVVTFNVSAGNQDGAANVACAPASGSSFPLGATEVSCTATDAKNSSLTASATFYVSVRDTTPPALHLPSAITTVATGQAGAAVSYAATATDPADPNPTVACTPVSGTVFPVGATTVSCTATDRVVTDAIAGNSGNNKTSGAFTVTVSDFSLEPITPMTILVGSSGTAQVNVDSLFGFNSPVALSVSGPASVLATLSPSSIIPAGGGKASSTLTLQLSPAVVPGPLQFTVKGAVGGLTHPVTLNVTVNADYSSVNTVITQITSSGGLDNSGISGSLSTKLSNAQSYISSGNTKDAKNALNALLNQISAQSGKHILSSCTDKNTGVTYNPVTVLSAEVNVLMLNLQGNADPIVGTVVNFAGLGVPGATVSISDSSGNIVARAVTDVTGFYFVADTSILTVGSSYIANVTAMPLGYTNSTQAQAPFTWQAQTTALSFMLQ